MTRSQTGRLCRFAFVLLAGLFACSCAVIMPAPGGVMPGLIVTSMSVPGELTDDMVYLAYPDSFTVLGMVEGKSSATNVLGLFAIGNAGYLPAIESAKKSVGADGLISCTGDVSGTAFLGIFATSKTTVRGYAIKRK